MGKPRRTENRTFLSGTRDSSGTLTSCVKRGVQSEVVSKGTGSIHGEWQEARGQDVDVRV